MTRDLDLDGPKRLTERSAVRRLVAALEAPGEETRIVGGAVRNALIGREVHEIDLATTALPADTMRRARAAGLKAVPTGIEHGTVTVVVAGLPFEVTTLREDVQTDGRHAVVRFGRSFEADALRRDFTMNALSVGPDETVRDYTTGLEDLAAGRVRFIGEACRRIREDYLRILRFFRFSADYAEGPLDAAGLDGAIRERDGLQILSRERIRAELLKLLVGRRSAEVVGILGESGLLLRLTGGVAECGRFGRAGQDAIGRLAALLVTTVEDADRLRDRLRLSNAEHERLTVHAHLLCRLRSAERLDSAEARRLAARFGAEALGEALQALAGEPRPVVTEDGAEQIAAYRSGQELAPVFPLTGADLIRRGIPAGPELGRRLAEAKRAWMEAGCPADWAEERV